MGFTMVTKERNLKKEQKPKKERQTVFTNNSTLSSSFVNKKRIEGGGANVKITDQDRIQSTTYAFKAKSQLDSIDIKEENPLDPGELTIEMNTKTKKIIPMIIQEQYNDPDYQKNHEIEIFDQKRQLLKTDLRTDKKYSEVKIIHNIAELREYALVLKVDSGGIEAETLWQRLKKAQKYRDQVSEEKLEN